MGGEVAAPEGGEICAETGEASEFGFGVFVGSGEGTGEGGVTDLEEADEFGAHFLEGGGVEIVGEGVVGESEGGLLELPVEEAVFFPFGEVLWANRLGLEFGGEEGLHFREGVEPLEEAFVLLAVIKPLIELVTELARKAGDFAGAGHRIFDFRLGAFAAGKTGAFMWLDMP